MTDAPEDDGPTASSRPTEEMRLRANRAPVTRLSRKVLLGVGAAAAIGVGGALLFALKPQHQTAGSELYNTNNRNTPDGLANLPRDYTGLPSRRPSSGRRCPAISESPSSMPAERRPACPRRDQVPRNSALPRNRRRHGSAISSPRRMSASRIRLRRRPRRAIDPAAVSSGSADLTSQDHKLAFLNGAIDRRTTSPDRIQPPRAHTYCRPAP